MLFKSSAEAAEATTTTIVFWLIVRIAKKPPKAHAIKQSHIQHIFNCELFAIHPAQREAFKLRFFFVCEKAKKEQKKKQLKERNNIKKIIIKIKHRIRINHFTYTHHKPFAQMKIFSAIK